MVLKIFLLKVLVLVDFFLLSLCWPTFVVEISFHGSLACFEEKNTFLDQRVVFLSKVSAVLRRCLGVVKAI